MTIDTDTTLTNHAGLKAWVKEVAELCKPDKVVWCDGSRAEYDAMIQAMVDGGTATRLNQEKHPGGILVRSNPSDVARVENRTFICSKDKKDAPGTSWADPEAMRAEMKPQYDGCMKGRTMYVIPYSMGPIGSPIANIGVELSDSAYVVANMHHMARVDKKVYDVLGTDGEFVKALHSVGSPLEPGQKDVPWPCIPDVEKKYIVHFPEDREIWSLGSGYGGNALLGKKCHALRIACVQARDEGWMAEHMLILKITNPEGVSKFVAAAFPSACGKTNLAMMEPTLPGWKIETIGDDIAWMKFGKDGRLYAINPEYGFFGVAPGTSMKTNPNAMRTLTKDIIYTNCVETEDGDVWWEEHDSPAPAKATDWKGNPWTPDTKDADGNPVKGAHPNARFTAPAAQCPVIAPEWEDPAGVPIDAILFGGRRAQAIPLATQARNWNNGTFMGSIMGSEMTAAAFGTLGALRRDPMAMLPFFGYNVGDYLAHWIKMGKTEGAKMPEIFYVNWFRKDETGKWLWPGFGENSRVLKWCLERLDGKADAVESAWGLQPTPESLDLSGLDIPAKDLETLLTPDAEMLKQEIPTIEEHYAKIGETLPVELKEELEALKKRLNGGCGCCCN